MHNTFKLAFTALALGLAGNAVAFNDIENNFWATLSCDDEADMTHYIAEYPDGHYAAHAKQCLNGQVGAGGPVDDWTLDYGELTPDNVKLRANPAYGGRTSYYIAPPRLLGNWRGYGAVALRLKTWGGTYFEPHVYAGRGDLVIASGGVEAHHDLAVDHSGEWTEYTIRLLPGEWTVSKPGVSLEDVLANVTDFRIRAEYGLGTDYSAISGVRLLTAD